MLLLYDDESRLNRARERALYLNSLLDLKGKRVLEIGCGYGDLSLLLAEEYGCNVVGIDTMSHDQWNNFTHENLHLQQADISKINFGENTFDRIVSYCVWEHIRHPYSALANCQRMLKPDGKKYLHAYLGGSPQLSHLYYDIKEPWVHLTKSVAELKHALGVDELPWYYWCNRLTHSHYLTYFRQLGFYITYEHIITPDFDQSYYELNEKVLGLYPVYDLRSSALLVVLEFDKCSPKEAICDPVYSKCTHNTRG